MNTLDIERVLSRLPIHTGVFAVDQRPDCLGLPGAYVFNLEPSTKEGTHWVAVFITRTHRAEYFDSFGRRPPIELEDYLKKYIVEYNDKIIQNPLSAACGAHCISFLYHRYKGIKMKDYTKRFTCDLVDNDRFAVKLLHNT